MTNKDKKLASELLRLDKVRVPDKIFLWLTYRKLKPLSAVDYDSQVAPDLIAWINTAGLAYKQGKIHPHLLYVSNKKEYLEEIDKLMASNERENILKKAKLFGYPLAAAEAQAAYYNPPIEGASKVEGVGVRFEDKHLVSGPWRAYLQYTVRRGHEEEDSLVAKKWWEIIRKELPSLHREYMKMARQIT
jgi:hypothetical protein